MEMKNAKATGDKEGVRSLLGRRLGKGSKIKPKMAKVLFKKWLEWEEKDGEEKEVEEVKRLAAEYAEQVKAENLERGKG